jgi:hypothetical protein
MKLIFRCFILLPFIFSAYLPLKPLNKDRSLNAKKQIEPKELTVYYDSMCGDSLNFIKYSFRPFYNSKELYTKFKVNLVAGSLMTNEMSNSFSCKHGYNECVGNIYHLCAKNLFSNDLYNQYVICYFDFMRAYGYNVEETSNYCSGSIGLNFTELKKCADTDQGSNLAQSLIRTKQSFSFSFGHSPLAIIDNNISTNEDEIFNNLVGFLCRLNGNKDNLSSCSSYYRSNKN